ncbi:MAG: SIMPL domain-containing protein [Bryobacterales bacterium]|nr:SIMPL domain-containing protein [Bryobacterales bacterium]
MHVRTAVVFAMGAALVCLTAVSVAQTVESSATGTRITASGEATVTVKPDQALLSIGVTTQAPTSQEAGSRNAQQTQNLLTALTKALGNSGDFKTSGYWINPQYDSNPAKPSVNRITSYVARNTVEVKIDDLSIVSKVIDAAVKAGSNNIGSLRFTLKDEQAPKTKALIEATAQAREKAAAMAKALGLRVTRVVSVSDSTVPAGRPYVMEARMAVADSAPANTPVEPGTMDVNANVTVVVEAR